MQETNETIRKLKLEVDYYKKQLNELSGSMVSRDYKVAEMHNEIRQMQTGFALIAALNQFKPNADFGEIFDHFTEEINIQLQNDFTLILQPDTKTPGCFVPVFIKGNTNNIFPDTAEAILIEPAFLLEKKSLLVNSQTDISPFIDLLIKRFGIPYFILTPVIVHDKVIACLFTGRRKETVLFASSRLMMHNAHALEAIAGVIAALKKQDDQFRLIVNERTRISSDMHDEIGSGITHIALLSELIQSQQQNKPGLNKEINVIATTARKLVQTMSEIIWSMNPQNDTLENLLAYTREQAQQNFESLNVRFEICFPEEVPDITLSNEQRRNLYLVTREALNNAIKHAGAANIQLKLEFIKNSFCFSVTDNGTGINYTGNKPGRNGLYNMKKRIQDIGGSIEWLSPGKGTTVKYCMPF